ncbi:KpsF/GutQ family sugar-phosphate isomerase [Verrucomicrobiaceae bacterium N1E253]|uniref:KpsF/GutQ family sugar-phosphate isomerase n=2 Tax=Oceaniferula marina TaxID=2748318 RepID=A0A851GML5_9BACT|nr:KpsF/GutQ family sugar-phosphate isomerase [Oceaniferula marina]
MEIKELERVADSLNDSFHHAVELLKKTLEAKGKIVVVGIGKSGNIGHKIAATLNSTGSTAVVLNSQNALHGDLGILSDGDAVIALSYSGETTELLDLLPFIKRSHVSIIGITGKAQSTLETHSDATLLTEIQREACPLNLAPTSSSTAMLVMGDALAMVLLEARGFTEKDFSRFHPGGALGRALLTKVSDIMRSEEQMATISPEDTVHDALSAMSQARSGACVIQSDDGTLAGIFTHGDFARSFQENPDIGTQAVKHLMTANPVTLHSDSLAAEAVNTISSHRIDDIVVLDTEGKPVGLVDTQDFARLKLI